MAQFTKPLVIALALGLASPLMAQDAPAADTPTTDTPAVADTATDTTAENLIGTDYVAATHGDWEVQCVHSPSGADPCQLYQLLKDADGNAVAEISLFGLGEGQPAAAGATIVTPLETMLTQMVSISFDGADPRRYPFTFCAQIGCVSRVGFTAEEVAMMKSGKSALLSVVPMIAPDQTVDLTISLIGFTAGYDAVNAANVLADAAAAAEAEAAAAATAAPTTQP
jgi:invasion protein IalB